MPGLVPGIHVLTAGSSKNVDGRDKPGHDRKQFCCLNYSRRISSQLRRYTAAKARSSSLACFIALS
jgi:hypothetical protein